MRATTGGDAVQEESGRTVREAREAREGVLGTYENRSSTRPCSSKYFMNLIYYMWLISPVVVDPPNLNVEP